MTIRRTSKRRSSKRLRTNSKKRVSAADKKATALLRAYVEKYHRLGLRAQHPGLAVDMFGNDQIGWPVHDVRGTGEIAWFTSQDAAKDAIHVLRREAQAKGIDA